MYPEKAKTAHSTGNSTYSSVPREHRYLVGNDRSFLAISDLRIGLWPLLGTIGLGLLTLFSAIPVTKLVVQAIGEQRSAEMSWIPLYANHLAMLVTALVLIALLSRGRIAEYGLRWPERKSYATAALAWGAFFGALMTVVDYYPQLLAHVAPEKLLLTPINIAGWLSFQGIFVGISEEIPFRGLLMTFLMQRTSGRVRVLKYDMHVAGLILALLFALAHVNSFWQEPLWSAAGQQVYAVALGILYAYWYEKSGSLLASILGHNASDFVEYLFLFLLARFWH
jgi:uncharacterized protein